MKTKLFYLFAVAALLLAGCDEGKDPKQNTEGTDPVMNEITITFGDDGSAEATVGGVAVTEAEEGDKVTLTATGAEGYVFKQWSIVKGGEDLLDITKNPVSFTMPAEDVEVTVEFKPAIYAIDVAAADYGCTVTANVASNAATEAEKDATVILTATANANSAFKKWVVTGVTLANDTANPATFKMPANGVGIKAVFGINSALPVAADGVWLNGVIWAARNVDAPGTFAATSGDAGMFYQWNRRVGWSATGDEPVSSDNSEWNGTPSPFPVNNLWEEGNNPCPTGWRVPAIDDSEALYNSGKVNLKWDATSTPAGFTFTDISSGNVMKLPALGCRFHETAALVTVGTWGYYWLNEALVWDSEAFGYMTNFSKSATNPVYYTWQANALPVRCVAK